MKSASDFESRTGERGFPVLLITILVAVIAVLTWAGIRKSHSDSLRLLVLQGTPFTESLAQAAENAMESESLLDFLIHLRYSEIAVELTTPELGDVNESLLSQTAFEHDLYGVYVYDPAGVQIAATSMRGPVAIPDFVSTELTQLLADPTDHYVLLLEEVDSPAGAVHYYFELSNRMDRVIVLVADASYHVEALRQTQIDYLAARMTMERGVEYILYQTNDGVVFSSAKLEEFVPIESDSFLMAAFESDTVVHRISEFQDQEILELVRPFSSQRYPFGLLRVGLSLEGYYSISRGFDLQMIGLAGALTFLLLVLTLLINSRRQRRKISRDFKHIKSVTDKIFDEMRTGVAAIGPRGVITLANASFAAIFRHQQPVGQEWDIVVGDGELAFDRLAAARSTETEVTQGAVGNERSLLVAVSQLSIEGESLPGLIAVVYDITRLKEFERQAARKARLSEMGNLAAGVAHEIRNPLNAISIAAQRLAAEFKPESNVEEYQSFTQQIRHETGRLNEIITKFLTLARDETTRLAETDISRLIQEQLDFLKVDADKRGIVIKAELMSTAMCNINPDQFKQVLINLYNNSCEALKGEPGIITVKLERVDNNLRLEFSDSGPGIPAALREKVLTPYFTTKDAGTGLGLPTVHKIITSLDGQLDVGAAEDGGALFTITLPLKLG